MPASDLERTKKEAVEFISYGGGSPSLALIVLNIKKQIKPITGRDQVDEIIFADTGWERSDIISQTKYQKILQRCQDYMI